MIVYYTGIFMLINNCIRVNDLLLAYVDREFVQRGVSLNMLYARVIHDNHLTGLQWEYHSKNTI